MKSDADARWLADRLKWIVTPLKPGDLDGVTRLSDCYKICATPEAAWDWLEAQAADWLRKAEKEKTQARMAADRCDYGVVRAADAIRRVRLGRAGADAHSPLDEEGTVPAIRTA